MPGAQRSQMSLSGSSHSACLSSREWAAGLALEMGCEATTARTACALQARVYVQFAGGQFAVGLHPLPSPSSQACLSGLASRPHWIPLSGSAGPSSCFPFCLSAWGKATTWHRIISLHLAPCPGSPGDQTWLQAWWVSPWKACCRLPVSNA